MTNTEKIVFARALADTFSKEELQQMRKKCLTGGINGKVSSWSDIGLSSAVIYDFNIGTAVDLLTAAIDIQDGKKINNNSNRIVKFVM